MDGINIYIVLINNFAKHLSGFVNGDYEVTPHRGKRCFICWCEFGLICLG
jgi:hypothetical protein